MNRTLEQLIELQAIDSRLTEISEVKGDLPQKVKKLTDQVDSIIAENQESKERIDEIDNEIRLHAAAVDDNTVKLKKYKEQLYLVTSNKEYDALLKEIDVVKNQIDESESAILKLEDEKTQRQESVKSNEIISVDVVANLEASSKSLKSALKETKKEEAELLQDREKFIIDIDPEVLKHYEKFRNREDGEGIIEITRGACGSCYYSLPPQVIIEVKRRDKLIHCPSCGIYMFYNYDE